jgi:hypothetical protein
MRPRLASVTADFSSVFNRLGIAYGPNTVELPRSAVCLWGPRCDRYKVAVGR